MSAAVTAIEVLWRRDLTHFSRERGRIVAAVLQPVLIWLFLGSGFAAGMRVGGVGYLEYFFPGMLLMVVLFASIFSTITVIEDRQEGFLRAVLAAPASRGAVVTGKILGSATLAFVQGAVLLPLAPLAGIPMDLVGALVALALLFLVAYGLSALGVWLAWMNRSTASFHAAMNFLLLPLWLLSGALFPLGDAPAWLEWTMRLDPLAYALQALRTAMYAGATPPDAGPGVPLAAAWAVCGAFAVVAHALAHAAAARGER